MNRKFWSLFFACAFLLVTCKPESLYELSVTQGTGSGRYPAEARVSIVADVPAAHRFVAWEGDSMLLERTIQTPSFLIMPARNAAVSAYTLPTGVVSFRHEVLPIIRLRCLGSDCHINSTRLTNFTDVAAVAGVYSKIEEYLSIGFMPLNRVMPDVEKQAMLTWIAQGRRDN